MKNVLKVIFISICLFYSCILDAQIKVVANGNVGVGISNPISKLAVNDAGEALSTAYFTNTSLTSGAYALKLFTSTPTPAYSGGSEFISLGASISPGYGTSRGIIGSCLNEESQSNGRAFGVQGQAGNATHGFNYGVFGSLLGDNQGAAIFGTTEGMEEYTGGYFAGYFKGAVYVSNYLSIGNKNALYPLDVTGTTRTVALTVTSDERLKEDITDIGTNPILSIKQLRGVSYLLKQPIKPNIESATNKSGDSIKVIRSAASSFDPELYGRRHMGFIAQEVQALYPELVYKDKDGILSIDYIGFIPIIVETLKKQDDVIANQALEIEKLKSALDSNGSNSSNNSSKAILYQNTPNPFNVSTTIHYIIPDNSKSAVIFIFNLQGSLICKKNLTSKGEGSISINASELNAGMYNYTLVVDGVEISSKRMILTD